MEAVQAEVGNDRVDVNSVDSELPGGGAVGSVVVITCFLGNENDPDWNDAQRYIKKILDEVNYKDTL